MNELPLAPTTSRRTLAQRLPFFYGWIMVATMFLAGMASSGPTLWGFSVFAVPMADDLGWSRATLFGAITARTLLMAALSPFIGRLADTLRRPQFFIASGGTIFALSLVGLSLVHSKVEYFLIFSLAGGVGMIIEGGTMRAAFVSKWFVRKRGRAMAIGTMGTAMAAFIYPVFTYAVIEALGWRGAWLVMGLASFLLVVPLAFMVRRQPEDIGLLPDGDTPEQIAKRRAQPQRGQRGAGDEYSFTVREVLHTNVVWFLVAAAMLAAPSTQGLTSSWVPRFRDVGIAPGAAATALTIYGLGSIVSRFATGFLVERYHVRKLLIAQMILMALVIVFLLNVRTAAMAMVYSAFQGFILGAYVGMNPLIYPTYFGRRHIGAIQGLFTPFATMAGAAGPLVIAWVFDATGSYDKAYMVLVAFWAAAAGLMYLARPPRTPALGSPEAQRPQT